MLPLATLTSVALRYSCSKGRNQFDVEVTDLGLLCWSSEGPTFGLLKVRTLLVGLSMLGGRATVVLWDKEGLALVQWSLVGLKMGCRWP